MNKSLCEVVRKVTEWCKNPPWLTQDQVLDLIDTASGTDDQQIQLVDNTIVLEDGGPALDLTPLLAAAGSDDQTITAFSLSPSGIATLTLEDGNTVTEDFSILLDNTDDQQISLLGTTITLEDGGTPIDLAPLLAAAGTDDQQITGLTFDPATGEITLTLEDGGSATVDISAVDTNTDDQAMTLVGALLTLEDGGTPIDLSPFLDNTDAQQLTLVGNTLALTNGGAPLDLSVYLDNTDEQTLGSTDVGGVTTSISISNGNSVTINHPDPPDPQVLETTTATFCEPVGWVNVNADGSVAGSCGGADAARTAAGEYTLTPPPGAETVVLSVIEAFNTRDSIEIHPVDFVGSQVHISEGDNGAAANTSRDRAFTAVWFGQDITVVQSATLT